MEKTNFKPFDLEAAKAGAPVCTRDGRDVELLKFDMKSTNPIVGILTQFNGSQECYCWKVDGVFVRYTDNTNADLVMKPQKKQGWKVTAKDTDSWYRVKGNKIDCLLLQCYERIMYKQDAEAIKDSLEERNFYDDVILEPMEWEE